MPEMNDERFEEMIMGLRESYNEPPETPREDMWAAIQARLGEQKVGSSVEPETSSQGGPGPSASEGVIPLRSIRGSVLRRFPKPLRWSLAAAALLVLGLGIGRMTAPGVTPVPENGGQGAVAAVEQPNPDPLRVAAVEHLARTESLLALVRADAREGRVEPTVGNWARRLLSQTRLLMDAQAETDPVMEDLLKDLELVLVQIVGVANAPPEDRARIQSELNLALDGMKERDVLPRIQAVIPAGPGYLGT